MTGRDHVMSRSQSGLIGVVLGAAGVLASMGGATADKLDDVKARGRLIVGVTESSPPFSYRDGENGIVGYDIDLASEVATRLGVGMEKIAIINAERIPSLQQDKVDLVATGMTRAENRKRDIAFSLAYLDSPHKVLVRKDAGIASVKRMAGRKLALVRSASVDAELKAAVPTLEIVLLDDYHACFTALQEKRVDGFLADEILLLSFASKSGAPQDFTFIADYALPRTAGFGIKKDERRFSEFVDDTLLALEASGEAARIFDKWFAPSPRLFKFQRD
jgi:polar amino acid transport system substrate-binding protein